MRRSLWKKLTVAGLTFSMVFSLAACGRGRVNSTNENIVQMELDSKEAVFSGEDIEANNVEGDPYFFVREDDKLYMITIEHIFADDENEGYTVTNRIYSMNTDGTDVKLMSVLDIGDNEVVQSLFFDEDNNLYFYSSAFDHETSENTYYLCKLDENGNVIEHEDITERLDPDGYISEIYVDNEGHFIAHTYSSVYVLDSDYKKISRIKCGSDESIDYLTMSKDGKLICGIKGKGKFYYVRELDINSKKFGDPIELNVELYGRDGLIEGDGDYDFYFCDDKGIYGYSSKDNSCKMIFDFLSSGVSSADVIGTALVDSKDVVIATEDIGGANLVSYKKVDSSDVKEKTVITFGSLDEIDTSIVSAASRFNLENDEYQIEFKDYSAEEDPQSKMSADIIAGNVPDIMDLKSLPVEQYVAKGILEDLTPYFENDEEISSDDILPSVKNAMEIDGKLYYVSTEFTIGSLCAQKKEVGDKTGWTTEEFKALLDEKDEDVRPFFYKGKEETLNLMMEASIGDYIDWINGECYFDSDSFKTILEIAGSGNENEIENEQGYVDDLKSGKILFLNGTVQPEDIEIQNKLFNAEVAFVGYPCEDGEGSYFDLSNQIGIYSKSAVKDGAWEFIRTLMQKDNQLRDEYSIGTPTNKDAFESYMKTKTATESYTDEYGREIEPNYYPVYMDVTEIVAGPLSSENEQIYRDLVDRTTKVKGSNDKALEIICDEASNYFDGNESLDEAAAAIQNRVMTYVSESR